MVQFKVGDTVTLCAALRPFCGSLGSQLYLVYDLDCAVGSCPASPFPYTWDCLTPSGVSVEFQWTSYGFNNTCDPAYKLKSLGTATTNSVGMATIQYQITQSDLDIYNNYIGVFDLRVCFNNGGTENRIYSKAREKADGIIIQSAPVPTHMIEYRVHPAAPDLLLNMVDYITPVVQYVANAFNPTWGYTVTGITVLPSDKKIQVYLAQTGSVDLNQIVFDIFEILLGAIVIVLAFLYFGVGLIFVVIALIALFVMGYGIYDLIVNQIIGRDDAITNLNNQNRAELLTDKAIMTCMDTYNASPMSKSDCLTLIDCLYDSYLGYIEAMRTYFDQIIVDTQKKNLETCYDDTKSKLNLDTIDCAAAIAAITSCGTSSKIQTTTVVNNTYNMGESYTEPVYPTCDQFSEQSLCENAGCAWVNGLCVRKSSVPEDCWIPGLTPGSCILTAKTGKTIAIIGGGAAGGYVLFKLIKSR